jgi:uncharacterized repeat protein (TIGR03803 family)
MKQQRSPLANVLAAILFVFSSAAATAQTFTTIKSFGILTNITGFKPFCKLVPGPQGALYGTTSKGEGNVNGTVFKIDPDSGRFTVLKWFTNYSEGESPYSSLAVSGHVLYGTTSVGGNGFGGTVFKLNSDGSDYTVLYNFSLTNGTGPGSLTRAGKVLYGTTGRGGASNVGTIFRLNTDGSEFAVLKHFGGRDGQYPTDGLVVSSGVIYGTTEDDGTFGVGKVFKLNTDGTGYIVLKDYPFSLEQGFYPGAGLILSGNVLYGTTLQGGTNHGGTVFSMNIDGSGYTILKHFGGDGWGPGRLELSGHTLYGATFSGGTNQTGTIFRINTDGSEFAVLKDLGSTDSAGPNGVTLYRSALYGTSYRGGSTGLGPFSAGTVFKIAIDGTDFTIIKDLTFSDGRLPYRGGVTSSGNSLYGTTAYGGRWDVGTIFRLDPDGSNYTILKQLNPGELDRGTSQYTNGDGAVPITGLIASDNTLFGATDGGGYLSAAIFRINADGSGYTNIKQLGWWNVSSPNDLTLSGATLLGTTFYGGSNNYGTIFKLNKNGDNYTVLKEFTGIDGQHPHTGLRLSDSTLYGCASMAGTFGIIFKLNTDGTGYAVIKQFDGTDGAYPVGTLALSGSTLYGTAAEGGLGFGTIFKINTDGSGFATIKLFAESDGDAPSGLLFANGVLYGTTFYGGSSKVGTVFQINADGSGFRVLKHFTRVDGQYPTGGLNLYGNSLYGTTSDGGALNEGTVFKIDLSNPGIEPNLQTRSAF